MLLIDLDQRFSETLFDILFLIILFFLNAISDFLLWYRLFLNLRKNLDKYLSIKFGIKYTIALYQHLLQQGFKFIFVYVCICSGEVAGLQCSWFPQSVGQDLLELLILKVHAAQVNVKQGVGIVDEGSNRSRHVVCSAHLHIIVTYIQRS